MVQRCVGDKTYGGQTTRAKTICLTYINKYWIRIIKLKHVFLLLQHCAHGITALKLGPRSIIVCSQRLVHKFDILTLTFDPNLKGFMLRPPPLEDKILKITARSIKVMRCLLAKHHV